MNHCDLLRDFPVLFSPPPTLNKTPEFEVVQSAFFFLLSLFPLSWEVLSELAPAAC